MRVDGKWFSNTMSEQLVCLEIERPQENEIDQKTIAICFKGMMSLEMFSTH